MRGISFEVDGDTGDVVISMFDGMLHAHMPVDAEEFGIIVEQANAAFGDSKLAAS